MKKQHFHSIWYFVIERKERILLIRLLAKMGIHNIRLVCEGFLSRVLSHIIGIFMNIVPHFSLCICLKITSLTIPVSFTFFPTEELVQIAQNCHH